MENERKKQPPIWAGFLVISLLFLWLGIRSSVIYKSSELETVNTYVCEKDITNEVSITDLPESYILNYNHKSYTIMKDRDTTIVLKRTAEDRNGILKEAQESLVYQGNACEIVKRDETVYKDTKRAKEISRLSIIHFILVGLPSYFVSSILFLLTVFIFVIWKDEYKRHKG